MLELNFNPFPIIETERLILRRKILADAPDFFIMRSNAEAMKYICKPLHTSVKDSETMILRINEMINCNDGIAWAITLKNQPNLIGSISFHRIEKEHYRAEIGYMLLPTYWKQGFISEAIKAIIDFGFNELKFHSIEAHIDPRNIGSEKTLQKFDFVKEAHFKENYFYNGQFLDTAVYSLLNSSTQK
jgi:ribosomal-protein-alanine N-acetyltransferase